jgi:uncharacterized membrane protein YkoI
VKALPAAVQTTLRKESAGKSVVRVDNKQRDGNTTYKIITKSPDGMQRRLFIDSNGKLVRLKNDITLDAVPHVVRKTADAESKAAKFVRSTKITHDAATDYELEYDVTGRSKTLLIDPQGKLERIEEVITAPTLPSAVKASVDKEVGKNTIRKIEASTETGKPTVFEVQFDAGGHPSEIKLALDGKVLERE